MRRSRSDGARRARQRRARTRHRGAHRGAAERRRRGHGHARCGGTAARAGVRRRASTLTGGGESRTGLARATAPLSRARGGGRHHRHRRARHRRDHADRRRSCPPSRRCAERARPGAGPGLRGARRSRSPAMCDGTSSMSIPSSGRELAISDHRSSQPTFDGSRGSPRTCHVAGMMSSRPGSCICTSAMGRAGSLVRRALDGPSSRRSPFHPTHVNRKDRALRGGARARAAGMPIDVTAFPVEDGEGRVRRRRRHHCGATSRATRPATCSLRLRWRRLAQVRCERSALGDGYRPPGGALFDTFAYAPRPRRRALGDVLPVFTRNAAGLGLGRKAGSRWAPTLWSCSMTAAVRERCSRSADRSCVTAPSSSPGPSDGVLADLEESGVRAWCRGVSGAGG